jgi:hypothetical protein
MWAALALALYQLRPNSCTLFTRRMRGGAGSLTPDERLRAPGRAADLDTAGRRRLSADVGPVAVPTGLDPAVVKDYVR